MRLDYKSNQFPNEYIKTVHLIKITNKKGMISTFTKKIIGIEKLIKPYMHKDKGGV